MGYVTRKLWLADAGTPDISPAYFPAGYDNSHASRKSTGSGSIDTVVADHPSDGGGGGTVGFLFRQYVSPALDLRGQYIATRAFYRMKQDYSNSHSSIDAIALQVSASVRFFDNDGSEQKYPVKYLTEPAPVLVPPQEGWTPTSRIYGYADYEWAVGSSNLTFMLIENAAVDDRLVVDVGFSCSKNSQVFNVTSQFGNCWLELYFYADDADQDGGTTLLKPKSPTRRPSILQSPSYTRPPVSSKGGVLRLNSRKMNT